MMEYTPGPWKWRHYEEGNTHSFLVIKPHVGAIAEVYDTTDDIPAHPTEGQANARLIAAAPDLLAALERLVNGLNDEWAPLFHSGGEMTAPELAALEQAEAIIARIRSN